MDSTYGIHRRYWSHRADRTNWPYLNCHWAYRWHGSDWCYWSYGSYLYRDWTNGSHGTDRANQYRYRAHRSHRSYWPYLYCDWTDGCHRSYW